MHTPSLGWQSWSPPTPHWSRLPRRDYSPRPSPPTSPSPITPSLHFTYWCSWYALGYFPSPKQILQNAYLIRAHNLPLTHILLDDGWRSSWVREVCHELHSLGFQVGLWYAPYTRHKNLPLYDTLAKLIGSCKLDFLKLDFLYAPYFDPHRYPNPSHALQNLFTYLTSHYPSLTTIGSGVPFADAIHALSVIRLSKDTALPYPIPRPINRVFYTRRLALLYAKYQIWAKCPTFVPDLDVRLFSLDTVTTRGLWDKMPLGIHGVGDDLTRLTLHQLAGLKQWLTP